MLGHLPFFLALAQIGIPPQPYPPPFGASYCAPVGSGNCDWYYIDGPTLVPGQTYPLIVMFHGHGGSHDPASWHLGEQAFIAAAKTWSSQYIVVLHDGGWNPAGQLNTYGCEEFQRATEAVLTEVAATWPVDTNRIYGYGLSMGGGECLSFAARHQDPTKPTMLAAAVNQSGTISMPRYYYAYPNSQPFQQALYGAVYGTSLADDFRYQRATALDLPFDGTFTAPLNYDLKWGFHLAHNLRWVSRTSYTSSADVPWTMTEPIQTFDAFLANSLEVNAPDQYTGLTGSATHRWDAIAPAAILGYFDTRNKTATLAQFSTQLPNTPGYQTELLLFSEDGVRHHCFSIQRADPSRFGRLHVKLYPTLPQSNALALAINHDNAQDNVARTTLYVDKYLSYVNWKNTPGNVVHLYAPGADLGTIDVVNVALPTSVDWRMNGGPWIHTTTTGVWSWSGGILSLFERTGVQRDWLINY